MRTRILIALIFLTKIHFGQNYTLTAKDTIALGQNYKCKISFDSVKYKSCNIELYFFDVKVPKSSHNTFLLEYCAILKENVYELKAIITNCGANDTTIIIKNKFYTIFDKNKVKGSPVSEEDAKNISEWPKYKSNKYKTFEEYIFDKLKSTKIQSREKLHFVYDITKNNKVLFIDVTIGVCSKEDKLILKKIVESCVDFKIDKPKKETYRTLMPLDLTKLK